MRKIFIYSIGLLLSLWCLQSVGEKAIPVLKANFHLQENKPDHTYKATITLINESAFPIQQWQLGLSAIRPILQIQEANITKQIGKYFLLAPKTSIASIPAHGKVILHVTGKGHFKNDSDIPSGYFIVFKHPKTGEMLTQNLEVSNYLKLPTITAGEIYLNNIKQQNTAIEDNPIQTTLTLAESQIVPLPVSLKLTKGNFNLQADTNIQIDDVNAKAAALFLIDSIRLATGYRLVLDRQSKNNVIIFKRQQFLTKENAEAYQLTVTPQQIIISATDAAGYFYAVQSLRQLLPPAIFSQQKQNNVWNIPAVQIVDYPRFNYRGLLLDSARHFMPLERIKRLLDLMALHKLNVFHWHLIDDEGWRLEIKRYPALTQVGAWRGYNLVMPPALGSGAKRYGGYYSQQQVRELIEYAKQRHITIIPEIEMPGHSRALMMSLPEQLIDKTDRSTYKSVQGYQDNVLTPCMESTYTVLENILAEVTQLFPSKIIHVGADEVPIGIWMQSPQCQTLMKQLNLNNPKQLQHYFITRIQKILQAHNKTMGGWEEIIANGDLNRSAISYQWTDPKKTLQAVKRDYSVVLMPSKYLYFDLAYNANPQEYGLYWAGYIDTFKAYSYQPIPNNMPEVLSKKILGIQGALWSEYLLSDERLDYMAFPRVAALAEVAWTPANRRNWQNFSARLGHLHLPRLDYYGVLYRIPAPGINEVMLKQNLLQANVEFPGMALHYTTDGSRPSLQSPLYRNIMKIDPALLKIETFTLNGRGNAN